VYGEALALVKMAAEYSGDECLIWPYYVGPNGYGRYRGGHSVHVDVCVAINGPKPCNILQAAHRCGNRLCFTYTHLYWATPKENGEDRVRHGTQAVGEAAGRPKTKLTKRQVRDIRASKETGTAIALTLGLHKSTVNNIITGKSWGWLE